MGELQQPIKAACFDWGGTLMSEQGPDDVPMARWPRVEVVDGARPCLAALHGRVPLYIATNASVSRRAMVERALGRVELLPFFDAVFCFTDIGYRKDQLGFWNAVSRQLDLPLARIAMVGDSLEQDVIAPRRFGVQAVWFNDGGRRPPADPPVPTVTRLETFADWVRDAV